jgi:hypothetical protein
MHLNKMRKLFKFTIIILILGLTIYLLPLLYLKLVVKPTESYPEETYIDSIKNKKALIIVAHHDDIFGSVAIAKWLCSNDWDVRAFYFKAPSYRTDSVREINGIASTLEVAEIIGLKEFTLIDQSLRNDSIVEDLNVPYEAFNNVFRTDTIEKVVTDLISTHKPSIIFTLDDKIGFYGHSDHVFVSRTITNVCQKNKSNYNFPVTMLYQTVIPPTQSEGVMVKYQKLHYFRNMWGIRELIKGGGFSESVYTKAKSIYNCDGMPNPDIQFKIDTLSLYKRRFLESWAPSEKKNLKRFIPFCYWYPHWIYYKMFNYEYFRSIRL